MYSLAVYNLFLLLVSYRVYDTCIRLSYAVWILCKLDESAKYSKRSLMILYDVACQLKLHLKVIADDVIIHSFKFQLV